jgi:heat shock protein HslJ
MKMPIVFGLLLLISSSCKTVQPLAGQKAKTASGITEPNSAVYFKASGNEPFWGLQVSESEIRLQSLLPGLDTVSVPHADPVKAMDANVKRYSIHTETVDLQIQIRKTGCEDSMSGIVSPYAVTVEIKKKTDADVTVLKGCGKYLTDQRLHDIWVLEKLNGRKAEPVDFAKELPLIEIYAEANTFMGFAGCNQMSGRLLYEKGQLRFIDIITTRMACAPGNKEGEFLKMIQNATTYEIKENRLWLSNPSGLLLVFKKVD